MAYVKQAHKAPTQSAPTKSFPLSKKDFIAKQTLTFKKIIDEVKNNKALIALLATAATKTTVTAHVPVPATVPVVMTDKCDDATLHFPHLDFHTQIIAFGDYQFTVSLPLQLSTDDGLRVFYPHVWQTYEDWQYDCFWDEIDSRESLHDY